VIRLAFISEYSAIRDLIIAGLKSHFEHYIPAYNEDLENFEQVYDDSTIVVATNENIVVGCGILTKTDAGAIQIVRMSVTQKFQRSGVGRKLLERLLTEAKTQGHSQVILETTVDWQSVVNFYLACGFTPTHVENGDQWFTKTL
jgi:GNAT superfamily N-acetyltransferase